MSVTNNWGMPNPVLQNQTPQMGQGYGQFLAALQNQDQPIMNWGMDSLPALPGADSVLAPLQTNPAAGAAPANQGWFTQDSMFGNGQTGGWAMPAIQGASALMQGWMGMEKLDLAKDQLGENKRQFNLNYGNSARLTNSRLADRQASRVKSGRTNVSVSDYMSKYGAAV